MNIQSLMREAQKVQKELQKTQKELENTIYEGTSSLIHVKMNGKKELVSVKINIEDSIEKKDFELLQDIIMVAVNDGIRKVDQDKEKKMSKYGQGLSGLL